MSDTGSGASTPLSDCRSVSPPATDMRAMEGELVVSRVQQLLDRHEEEVDCITKVLQTLRTMSRTEEAAGLEYLRKRIEDDLYTAKLKAEQIYDHAVKHGTWQVRYRSIESFRAAWIDTCQAAESVKRDRARDGMSSLKAAWGKEAADAIAAMQPSGYAVKRLVSFARREAPDRDLAFRLLGRGMIARHHNRPRGVSATSWKIEGYDVGRAVEMFKDGETAPLTEGELRSAGAMLGPSGLPIGVKSLAPQAQTVYSDQGSEYQNTLPQGTDSAVGSNSDSKGDGRTGGNDENDIDGATDANRSEGQATATSDTPAEMRHEAPTSTEDEYSTAENRTLSEDEELAGTAIGAPLPQKVIAVLTEPRSHTRCRCDPAVPSALRDEVATRYRVPLTRCLVILGVLLNCMDKGMRVCFYTLHRLGSHLGLMLKQLGERELIERLRVVFAQRHRVGALKVGDGTYRWFRVINRPARAADALGIYNYLPYIDDVFRFNHKQVFLNAGGTEALWKAWGRDGTVNVDKVFSWWYDQAYGIIREALIEFDMYKHHLRRVNGKSNLGWLRNMIHSLAQQLMRQDPVYYALYCSLRPDNAWRLISYPYYAKYAEAGDETFFRHLDLNIPWLISDKRGECMIQGTMSLDNEICGNCTELVKGFHRGDTLARWWKRVEERGLASDGFVHRVSAGMYNEEDARDFGPWVQQPCAAGAVRISMPHLPHGSTGPCTCVRRTLFPWYVAIQDDHLTLEVVEGGTWNDLSQAHRDLVPAAKTPSGHPFMYGRVPFKFPAAVELSGLGALSDALVGRRQWTSPAVIKERNIILGNDREAFDAYVDAWRKNAVQRYKEAFKLVEAREREVFREKSFFMKREGHEPQPDDEPPAEEEYAKDPSVFIGDFDIDGAIAEEMQALPAPAKIGSSKRKANEDTPPPSSSPSSSSLTSPPPSPSPPPPERATKRRRR
jgi:hypothetical protein